MSSKFKKIYIIVLIILIAVIPLIFLCYSLLKVDFQIKNFKSEITLNYNDKYKESYELVVNSTISVDENIDRKLLELYENIKKFW